MASSRKISHLRCVCKNARTFLVLRKMDNSREQKCMDGETIILPECHPRNTIHAVKYVQ